MAIQSKASLLPRYVRINTLKISDDECLKALKDQGYQVVRLKKSISLNNFKKFVEKLESSKIYLDPHVENLLIFPKGTDLHAKELVKNGSLILQDKVNFYF